MFIPPVLKFILCWNNVKTKQLLPASLSLPLTDTPVLLKSPDTPVLLKSPDTWKGGRSQMIFMVAIKEEGDDLLLWPLKGTAGRRRRGSHRGADKWHVCSSIFMHSVLWFSCSLVQWHISKLNQTQQVINLHKEPEAHRWCLLRRGEKNADMRVDSVDIFQLLY